MVLSWFSPGLYLFLFKYWLYVKWHFEILASPFNSSWHQPLQTHCPISALFRPSRPPSPLNRIKHSRRTYRARTLPPRLGSSPPRALRPLRSHISEFPLIRILSLNPHSSPLRGGLAVSPLANRTIAGEAVDKRPTCWQCAVLNWVFSLARSLFLPLTDTDSYSSSLSAR